MVFALPLPPAEASEERQVMHPPESVVVSRFRAPRDALSAAAPSVTSAHPGGNRFPYYTAGSTPFSAAVHALRT